MMPEHDDQLEQQLRAVLETTEAPPAHLLEAAKTALAWQTVDAELAALVADSADRPAAALRSTQAPQLLTFTSGDTTIVLEVARERRDRRLIGQIIAPGTATVEVRHAGGVVTVDADADGRFRAAPVAAGPMSVTCHFDEPQRAAIVTSWVAI